MNIRWDCVSIKLSKNSPIFCLCVCVCVYMCVRVCVGALHRGTAMWLTQMTGILLGEWAGEVSVEYWWSSAQSCLLASLTCRRLAFVFLRTAPKRFLHPVRRREGGLVSEVTLWTCEEPAFKVLGSCTRPSCWEKKLGRRSRGFFVSPRLNAKRFHEKRKQWGKRCKSFVTRF